VFPANSTEGHYRISAPTQTQVAYSLTATPLGNQARDTGCANFTIDQANTRGVSGGTPWRECWNR